MRLSAYIISFNPQNTCQISKSLKTLMLELVYGQLKISMYKTQLLIPVLIIYSHVVNCS